MGQNTPSSQGPELPEGGVGPSRILHSSRAAVPPPSSSSPQSELHKSHMVPFSSKTPSSQLDKK